jgi:hypothetical protein
VRRELRFPKVDFRRAIRGLLATDPDHWFLPYSTLERENAYATQVVHGGYLYEEFDAVANVWYRYGA